jgi:hypothetical protein
MLFKQSGVTKGPGTSQACFLPSNMPRIWQKLLPTNNSVDGSCGTVCWISMLQPLGKNPGQLQQIPLVHINSYL